MKKNYDFSGWATRNDLKCADGRTIRANAFADQNGKIVPLVWNHNHGDLDEVIGHALLENRPEGVYTYGFFNDTEKGRNAKLMVQHGDLTALSICANKLKQDGGNVLHGIIREVSLVLAGANPGAYIDTVMAHADGSDEEAIIYTGDYLVHSEPEDEVEIPEEEPKEETTVSEDSEDTVEHAAGDDSLKAELAAKQPKEGDKMPEKEKTVQDVIDSMTEEQKNVMYALVGMAAEDKESSDKGDEEEMDHNLFSNEGGDDMIMHAEIEEAMKDAKRYGSMRESFIEHGLGDVTSLEHTAMNNVQNLGYLFPDYKNVNSGVPFINTNPSGWISVVNNGVHHTPFAKIKMVFADITMDTARAKGYLKGNKKTEEVFRLLKREVSPTTIYKKQGFDRDDLIDITDLDVVSWIKGEMRIKLDEERARAYLFGDGRGAQDNDKINEAAIIPVIKDTDQNLYAMKFDVTPNANETIPHAISRTMVKAMDSYEGSGNVILFLSAGIVSDMLLEEDQIGHRLHKNLTDLAAYLGVEKVVKVPASVIPEGFYGCALDLKDYNVGANKGGQVNLFDDFDIDYNQYKYLIEARCSGALTLPHSAIVLAVPSNNAGE